MNRIFHFNKMGKITTLTLPFLLVLILIFVPRTLCDSQNTVNFTDCQYSTWNKSIKYISSTEYNARGMAPLYNLTHMILNLFIGAKAIPDDYVMVNERDIYFGSKVQENDWGDLIKHYWPILLVILLTALLVVLMPIIGLCFCCCRCAGACGSRSEPFDKKHDTCRRVFLGLLLIGAGTSILFGVVVAFVTNSYMQEGIEEATIKSKIGIEDTKIFLNSTVSHIDFLLVNNFDELSAHLGKMLEDTSEVVIKQLEEKSRAVSLTYITEFVNKLHEIILDLDRMKVITNELRVNASLLSDGLRGVKRELLLTLTRCDTKECRDILQKYEIGKLDANGIDYNQLPDVSEIINSIRGLIANNITGKISTSIKSLNNMRNKINSTIADKIPIVKASINETGEVLKNTSKSLQKTYREISKIISVEPNEKLNLADKYINDYGIYRFYFGIIISSTLLLILLCITLALFCGVCGKRPDGYGDDCCNKGSGSRFLLLAVAVIFLTISALAIVALIHFLAGLLLHRGVCVPLRNPDDQVFEYIDKYIDLNNILFPNRKKSYTRSRDIIISPPLRISDVIIACHHNQSIYRVLKLENFFNVSEILDFPNRFGIKAKLKELVSSIKIEAGIKILTPDIEEAINKLAESKLKTFDADKFVNNLDDEITNDSLKNISETLRKTADKIPNDPSMNDVRISLLNQALHLETYDEKLVKPMHEQTLELKSLAKKLESELRYNNQPFDESIQLLYKEINDAQNFINSEGTNYVQKVANDLSKQFTFDIYKYLNLVIASVENVVGYCAPLAKAYDSLIISGCNRIVDPFNGFWAGVGWCVIIFLPTIVISVKLSGLYQKSDPYPGPLVESEYLYDAYSERDNIPLATGPKNKRRKSKERRRSSRDRRADYFEDSGSSSHGAPSGRDTRYSDMAPKHWDNGPPRYQNPPMAPPASEYERPPPYYYPEAPSEVE